MLLDKSKFMSLHYYDYGEVFGGSLSGMQYRLEKGTRPVRRGARQGADASRVSDATAVGGEETEPCLVATVWPGPYNFYHTAPEKKRSESFPFSPEGKDAADDWLEREVTENAALYEAVPSILDEAPYTP